VEPSQTVAARDARPATGVPDRKGRHVRYHPRSTQRSEVSWKMEGGVVVVVDDDVVVVVDDADDDDDDVVVVDDADDDDDDDDDDE